MRCYVTNEPCGCSLDEAAEGSCLADGPIRGPVVDEDWVDILRGGELCPEDHLVYLNGLRA